MKVSIIFNGLLKGKRDVFIADNDNNIFIYNDQELQGDVNRFIYEVLDISYEWKERYENPNILDGMNYSLTVIKNNETIKEVTGQNAFPDNFHELLELLDEVKENEHN